MAIFNFQIQLYSPSMFFFCILFPQTNSLTHTIKSWDFNSSLVISDETNTTVTDYVTPPMPDLVLDQMSDYVPAPASYSVPDPVSAYSMPDPVPAPVPTPMSYSVPDLVRVLPMPDLVPAPVPTPMSYSVPDLVRVQPMPDFQPMPDSVPAPVPTPMSYSVPDLVPVLPVPDSVPDLVPDPVIIKKTKKFPLGAVVGSVVGLGVLVGLFVLVGFSFWRRRRAKEDDEFEVEMSMENKFESGSGPIKEEDEFEVEMSMEKEFESGSGPKKFSFSQLSLATNNFGEEQKLGEGGFGGVYRGFLRESNSYIAVKRISNESEQGIKEYATEVKIISRLRHRNLVQLIGWCHEKKELLLVYEFMENASLDFHLFKGKSLLTWGTRYKIAQGLASALLYLHEELEQYVVHRDIKSSNVMLDSNFNAKFGDFGLARFVDHEKEPQTTALAGTMGYLTPEYVVTGKASKESDVYSFGVVALEIACGRKPFDMKVPKCQMGMVEWVWDLYGMGRLLEAADPKLGLDFNEKEMEQLMIVGLWCAHLDHNFRPTTRQVILVLNFDAPLPILPKKQPAFFPALSNTFTTRSDTSENQYSINTGSSKLTSSSAASSS